MGVGRTRSESIGALLCALAGAATAPASIASAAPVIATRALFAIQPAFIG
jgi:hypothetical protein